MLKHVLILLLLLPAVAVPADDLLAPEQAFRFSARALDAKNIEIRYDIAEGYYLYRDKFKFSADPAEAKPGQAQFPPGKVKDDEFFGKVETYRNEVKIRLPVDAPAELDAVKLTVTSQGCADIGVCYPPNPQTTRVVLAAVSTSDAAKTPLAEALGEAMPQSSAPSRQPAAGAEPGDESSRIAHFLKQASFWLIIVSFFGFGVLLAATPCVFPMIPILSGIIVGQGHAIGRGRALSLSLAYVLGMAVTYAVAGVAAGLSGALLSSALQNPWVLGSFAVVFVILALSMFGFYELQMPAFLQSRLSDEANRQRGGSVSGVAMMGVLSAVIVGPCVAAPLAGALLYIAQTRDALLGGTALFFMALGMGAPLIALGVSTHALLPKAGAWMEAVKKFFGVMLLAVAIWLVSPVVPPVLSMLAWAGLLIFSAIYLHALDPLPANAHGWQRFWKGVGVVALLVGASLVVGVLAGSRDPLQPLAVLRGMAASGESAVKFERVRTSEELDARLRSAGRPVMLDFYAEWCVSCKEMERFTFTDPAVQTRMRQMVLLQADVTDNTDADKALLKRFGLFGPPGIIFFDGQGNEISSQRVIGFQSTDKFAGTLDRVLIP
jgi:thiol:disulfide interchange protein DsbD